MFLFFGVEICKIKFVTPLHIRQFHFDPFPLNFRLNDLSYFRAQSIETE